MALIRGLWNACRGTGLLAFLAVLFTVVLIVSCLTQLLAGDGSPGHAGRLQA